MYTMKQVCDQLNLNDETLRFYCNEGLVPGIKRDKNNYRVFSDENIAWLEGILHLRKCGMSIKDMKLYMAYCFQGQSSVPERKVMLEETKKVLLEKIAELDEAVNYIDTKQQFYDDILDGKIEYLSNLVADEVAG